eukprot:m.345189 g.345189  ORF g.345189 m.345189 type:complete len:486 (+) comp25874_c0_seq1:147-1604(+)
MLSSLLLISLTTTTLTLVNKKHREKHSIDNITSSCIIINNNHLTELYMSQPLNHFGFQANEGSYSQRYLVWNNCTEDESEQYKGIMFFTGNEGDIEVFAGSYSGNVYNMAEQTSALLVFAEHRYYGNSIPAYKQGTYEYLSSEQAMADYVRLIQQLKMSYFNGNHTTPVVSIGGSYGGMLAAYMRFKFPHIVTGAIAASAPVVQDTSTYKFYDIVARDFASCAGVLQEGYRQLWSTLQSSMGNATKLDHIKQTFHTCTTPTGTNDSNVAVLAVLQNALVSLAQLDYPYSIPPLPASPVSQACENAQNKHDALQALAEATSISLQPGGCWNISNPYYQYYPGLFPGPWSYQRCGDVYIATAISNNNTLFLPCSEASCNCFNENDFALFCNKAYNSQARPNFNSLYFGATEGDILHLASNIVFTNGELDPWGQGGINVNNSDRDVTSFWIEGAAHHLDLRAPNEHDPPSIHLVRAWQLDRINSWFKL